MKSQEIPSVEQIQSREAIGSNRKSEEGSEEEQVGEKKKEGAFISENGGEAASSPPGPKQAESSPPSTPRGMGFAISLFHRRWRQEVKKPGKIEK